MAARRLLFMAGALFGAVAFPAGSLWLPSETGGANEAYAPVAHSAPLLPAGAVTEGPLASSTELHVSVVLQPSDPSGLEQLASGTATPGSPSYRQFLSPSEIEQRFGASPDTLAAVRSWLTSSGLSVQPTTGDGLDIPAVGTAAQMETVFHTALDQAVLPSGRGVFVNASPPEVPASLQPSVAAVLGLDNLVVPQPLGSGNGSAPIGTAHVGLAAKGVSIPGAPTPCAAASQTGGQTADLIAQRYGLSPLYQQGVLGQGMTVGLLESRGIVPSDLATFDQCYGISTNMTTVSVDGGDNQPGDESNLDLDMVAGLAPQAQIIFYAAQLTTYSQYYDILATMVQQNQAQVLSTSYGSGGECEADVISGGTNIALAEAPLFEDMALQGQTMVASAGDAGSASCSRDVDQNGVNTGNAANPYALAVSNPASQPFVTAVGGTELNASGTEVVWNQSGNAGDGSGWIAPFNGQGGNPNGYPGNTAGTGGISALWPMPAWQVGFDTSGNSSGAPCGAPAGTTCREVPDVSALASGVVAYRAAVSMTTPWHTTGGTSAAAPEWAAAIALIDQTLPGNRVGLISPSLYAIEQRDPSAFFDVVTGTNNFLAPTGTPNNDTCTYGGAANQSCYQATVGYDMATGLGTPNATRLRADLANGGYWMAGADGGVFAFGDAGFLGSMGGQALTQPVVGLAGTPDGHGYWEVASDGGVFTFGALGFFGSMGGKPLNQPIVGLAATADVGGYWEVAADGGIFAFGDAGYHGSMGGQPLNAPIVGMAATADGMGYWEVASDGGIFAFGDAGYYGSMGGTPLNKPIVGIAATPNGKGYWEVASDGGIFAFGDAGYYGSMGGTPLNQPVVGIAPSPGGTGYWEVAADGGIFTFGSAAFLGSMGGHSLVPRMVGIASG